MGKLDKLSGKRKKFVVGWLLAFFAIGDYSEYVIETWSGIPGLDDIGSFSKFVNDVNNGAYDDVIDFFFLICKNARLIYGRPCYYYNGFYTDGIECLKAAGYM